MERLIIRVDASTAIGSGHFMRCLALAQAWKDAGGEVTFITACNTEGLLQRLREENFTLHLLSQSHPHESDWDNTSKVLASHPKAWVVLDGNHLDGVYQQSVKASGHRLLVIDDNAHLKHYYPDILLNQNLHATQLHYFCEPYTRLLLGMDYALLRREFLTWKGWKRKVPEVARHILVTLGGSDPMNNTLKVIQALQITGLPDLETIAIIGVSNPNLDSLKATTTNNDMSIQLIHDSRNMPELMSWADMAISASGSTYYELAFMGVPGIVMTVCDDQRFLAERLGELGLAINLGWHENISAHTLAQAISQLLGSQFSREAISRRGPQLVDGRGTGRVIELQRNKLGILS